VYKKPSAKGICLALPQISSPPPVLLAARFLLQLLEPGLQVGNLDRAEVEAHQGNEACSHSGVEPA
jgi:hypothetical protein